MEYNESPSFFDIVGLISEAFSVEEARAKSLEKFIVETAMKPGLEYTPYDILAICYWYGYRTKENSVRRALCNLSDPEKHKEKTPLLKAGTRLDLKYSHIANTTYKLNLQNESI